MMVSLMMFPMVPDSYFVSQELLSNGLCRCPSLQEALTAGWGGEVVVTVTSGNTFEMLHGIDRNFCYMKLFVSLMVYCRFGEVIIM